MHSHACTTCFCCFCLCHAWPYLQLLLAACNQEVQAIINLCTNHEYSGLQFVVHIYEVLAALPDAGRVISRVLPHLGCDQAESFTLHYVEALMGPATTWALAAEYLAWCPVHGADVLEGLLDRTQVRGKRWGGGRSNAGHIGGHAGTQGIMQRYRWGAKRGSCRCRGGLGGHTSHQQYKAAGHRK